MWDVTTDDRIPNLTDNYQRALLIAERELTADPNISFIYCATDDDDEVVRLAIITSSVTGLQGHRTAKTVILRFSPDAWKAFLKGKPPQPQGFERLELVYKAPAAKPSSRGAKKRSRSKTRAVRKR